LRNVVALVAAMDIPLQAGSLAFMQITFLK